MSTNRFLDNPLASGIDEIRRSWGWFLALGIVLMFLGAFCVVADVLSEEIILKWYKDAHAPKGKSVFLEQMKKFVEWLENAEEGRFLENLALPFVSSIC